MISFNYNDTLEIQLICQNLPYKYFQKGRMNFPGKSYGNWKWRFTWDEVKPEFSHELASITKLYGRI